MLAGIARIVPTTAEGSSDPTMGGRHIPPSGTAQAERSTITTLRQIGPVLGWAVWKGSAVLAV